MQALKLYYTGDRTKWNHTKRGPHVLSEGGIQIRRQIVLLTGLIPTKLAIFYKNIFFFFAFR